MIRAILQHAVLSRPRLRVRKRGRWARALTVVGVAFAGGCATMVTEGLIRARLPGLGDHAPSRIYARPLFLRPGAGIERDALESHLIALGYRRSSTRRVEPGEFALGYRTWVVGRRPFRHFDRVDPGGTVVVRTDYDGRITGLRDEHGRRVETAMLEPELLATMGNSRWEDRIPVSLPTIPQHLIDAVLSIEDQRFFEHRGLDLKRIVGATIANLRALQVVEGASTITQQLAKNLFLSARRTPLRKLREAALALVLEDRYDKNRILETYLNEIYLGQDGAYAIHGMGRAAQFFFGKDVTDLDLADAALLAGIIRGPSLYAPRRHPNAARRRRDLVLRIMWERGLIGGAALETALAQPLRLVDRPPRRRIGRHFVDYVREQLRERIGDAAASGGLAVFTTLDTRLQRLADDAVRQGLHRIENEYPQVLHEDAMLEAALVAIDPHTGEVLAMVGGRDYGRSQFNRATAARRQPGSAFKPVVALAALARDERDRPLTLATRLDDAPLAVETPAGLWEPQNYDGRFRGSVTLREALERSLNVPFARLGLAVGPGRVVAAARDLGIVSPLEPYPSIALGAFEVTPLELTRAFAVLAASGFRAETRTTLAVVHSTGEVLEGLEHTGEWVYDPAESFLVTSALQGAVERGTGRGLRAMGFSGAVAAKSGTSSDFRDAWFIGYTPTIAVGVWVGFDDGRSVGLPGSKVALPIFARFLAATLGRSGREEFPVPAGVEIVEIDPETGLRAGPGCWGTPEVFLRGTAPEESCSRYWSPRRYTSSRFRVSVPSALSRLRRLLRGDRDE